MRRRSRPGMFFTTRAGACCACQRRAYVEEQTLNAIRAAPTALHFLSTIAAVLSPFFLFLMALALRLKFRMSI